MGSCKARLLAERWKDEVLRKSKTSWKGRPNNRGKESVLLQRRRPSLPNYKKKVVWPSGKKKMEKSGRKKKFRDLKRGRVREEGLGSTLQSCKIITMWGKSWGKDSSQRRGNCGEGRKSRKGLQNLILCRREDVRGSDIGPLWPLGALSTDVPAKRRSPGRATAHGIVARLGNRKGES